jgi:NTP pyrophosphatase (non-canonical NTP hydrolase)
MNIDDFEQIVIEHSLCSGNLLYTTNALCGEAGEVANLSKKIQIAELKPEWVNQNQALLPTPNDFKLQMMDELGDVLFYLTRAALELGIDLDIVMERQYYKLKDQSREYGRIFLK